MTVVSKLKPVTEVLHFTTNRGLVGSFAIKRVLSRRRLPEEFYLEHVVHNNSHTRPEEAYNFDKSRDWLDFVNMSIDEINSRFFRFSEGWERNAELWWAILAFTPEILDHEGVVFTTTNNGYEHCCRASGPEGMAALYEQTIRRKGDWIVSRRARADNLPTCEQAEVLYPEGLDTQYLTRVYVAREEDSDRVYGWLREFGLPVVPVIVAPGKFKGAPN